MPLPFRLLDRWQLKLLAVLLAVALWVFVAAEDQGEAVYTVPLGLTGIPPGFVVAAVDEHAVDVRVQGRRSVLARLRSSDLRVEVSLRGARAGEFTARLAPQNVTAPRGVRVLRVSPSRVRGTLEGLRGSSG